MPGRSKNRNNDGINSVEDLFLNFIEGVSNQIDRNTEGTIYNIEEFIENELNIGITLEPLQMIMLKAFYGVPLDEEQISILEYWKSQGRVEWDFVQKAHQFMVLEAGRRSGKTLLAALIGSYEFYKLCKLPNPQEHYGIAFSTPIAILVLATSAKQGKQTIFGNIAGIVKHSPYFQRLKAQGKLFIGREEIRYDDKGLGIFAGNSESAGQVGGTLKAFIMDEFARFQEGKEGQESNALELWSNLGISATTFGSEAVRVAISSAWEENDPMVQLREKVKGDPASICFTFCSWQVNPKYASRDNPVVASEYLANPERAALEFEGIRPQVASSFFNADEVDWMYRGKNDVMTSVHYEPLDSGRELVKLNIDLLDKVSRPVIVTIDPAVSLDGYALSYGHNEFDADGNWQVVVDGMMLWKPELHKPVMFSNVYDIICELSTYLRIREVASDHYTASVETLQKLQMKGIKTNVDNFTRSFQLEMYDMTRKLMHEERLYLPKNSQIKEISAREFKRVMLLKGQKIDHPPGAGESKDTTDTVCLLVKRLAQYVDQDRFNIPVISTASGLTKPTGSPTMQPPKGREYQEYENFDSYGKLIRDPSFSNHNF